MDFTFSKKRLMNFLVCIPLLLPLFSSVFCYGQNKGEFEIGVGSAIYNEVGFSSDLKTNLSCIQLNIDHDLVNGPFRVAVGVEAVYANEYRALIPGVKLGFDVFNVSLHLNTFNTQAFVGLGSRIVFDSDKKHALSLHQKISPDIYGTGPAFLYSLTSVGYSYRF